jgi:DNA repair protein RAD16
MLEIRCTPLSDPYHLPQMVKAFNEDPEISVLLVSLKAGGVALNLTAANYIFVMDPWWNPGQSVGANYPNSSS